MIADYLVYPVKKVTEDDPVNLVCLVILVYPVYQVQEDPKVYLVVMVAMELKENLADQDSMDSPVVPVNLVYLEQEDQRVNLHKHYLDLKAKLEKWDLQVFLVQLDLLVQQVFQVVQVQLVSLDVKVKRVNVVMEVDQVTQESVLAAKKVKKENQVHLLHIQHHLWLK